MADWSDLKRELDLWRDAGRVATFWWRDDDAVEATPALEPLLALSQRHGVPVHLAVVPAGITSGLVARVAEAPLVQVVQHGLAHRNHEPKGAGASEFGAHRDLALQIDDLRRGWRLLADAGFRHLLPVFVPPWNRICDPTLRQLPGLGYRALSAFEGPTTRIDLPDLLQLHAMVDPIRWKKGHDFRGAEVMLDMIVAELADRRAGRSDPAAPTGLLTHHLQTGPAVWTFVNDLMTRLADHGNARWISLSQLIGPP